MAFNIHNFRAQGPVFGLARPTLFEVNMNWPSVVSQDLVGRIGAAEAGSTNSLIRKFAFMCKAASLPASILDSVEVGYFGRKIKVNGDRSYENWTVSIMNDEDFWIRNAFELWHNGINRIIGNTLDPNIERIAPQPGQEFQNSYKVDAVVYQMAKTGGTSAIGELDGDGVLKSYRFNGIFPIAIDEVRVDWDATNQFEMFDVTFAVDWWEPYVGSDAGPWLGDQYGDGSAS